MDENISIPYCYTAFLLRFWNEPSLNSQTGLRMILIDLRTGQKWGFADMERLFDFLEERVLPDDGGTDEA